ncbi:hypothetical protein TVAG_213740 [Trichomonas vaginalis G3]|uniref:Uncharacterized protein n=1 Tax=Trichomonas vaginalis (strain ATCC PRA-98 / G3) TaxID=412133 RepID=A2EYV5_TRIV3|nr:hypothetical protein TVAGG3_0254530 [Trichomonas vaginalis G3]EAY02174.1 hypothetical protein TVAG_213740 [Trichomonas vaginalis G3]KAI5554270.1 hypothetical protein TVAGG3_0254530 [Trichomonas vaginalis G3]|eukprot:XP_001330577.1 hypothetical protein [Trichomonas vaginalis G3]
MEQVKKGKLIIIKRDPPKNRTSDDYSEFRKKMDDRRRKVGKLYSYVENFLNSFPKLKRRTDIMHLAIKISERLHIPIDRNAKRLNEPLICWFCENWFQVYKYILPVYIEMYAQPETQNSNVQNLGKDQDFQRLDQEIQKIMQEIGDMDQFNLDENIDKITRSVSSDIPSQNDQ